MIHVVPLRAHRTSTEVITDRAAALANLIDELIPAAFLNTGQYELGVDVSSVFRLATAFDELQLAI